MNLQDIFPAPRPKVGVGSILRNDVTREPFIVVSSSHNSGTYGLVSLRNGLTTNAYLTPADAFAFTSDETRKLLAKTSQPELSLWSLVTLAEAAASSG